MDHLAKYRFALDITPVPLMLVDPNGQILLANTPFCETFGYDFAALKTLAVEDLMPPRARKKHPKQRSAYFRLPTKRKMGTSPDICGLTRDGREIPLELGIEPIVVGQQTCALVVAMDVTERKTREAQVRQALDASASPMVLADPDGLIVLINSKAAKLLGYDEQEILGKSISVLVPEPSRVTHDVLVRSYMTSPLPAETTQKRQIAARHKDGESIPVDITLTRIDTPQGWLVMSTLHDLREQINNAAAMEEKSLILTALNDELAQFAYSASHDLKAPLVSVMGLLRMCLEDLEDGKNDELSTHLTRALDICQRSSAQVEGVLELARAGNEPVTVERVHIATLVRNLWENLTTADDTPHLTLNIAEDLWIETEPITLRVILDNLMSNALKYHDTRKPRPQITVTARRDGPNTTFVVSDNGIGIDARNTTRIFDIFQSFDGRGGAGLGLALVKKHIGRLGGKITVDTAPGLGTTMSFMIPDRS